MGANPTGLARIHLMRFWCWETHTGQRLHETVQTSRPEMHDRANGKFVTSRDSPLTIYVSEYPGAPGSIVQRPIKAKGVMEFDVEVTDTYVAFLEGEDRKTVDVVTAKTNKDR